MSKRELWEKIAEYVDTHNEDIYVDYQDELSNDQVDKILRGRSDDVRSDIEDNAYMYSDLDYYWKQCAEELGCTVEDIDEWLGEEGYSPSVSLTDSDWQRLLENTTVNISAIVPTAEWNFNSWAYGQPIEYSEIKDSLRILGLDPYEFREVATGGSRTMGEGKFRGWFPKMPERVPKVKAKELFDNLSVLYNGILHFSLGDLAEIEEVVQGSSKFITFKKGTNIVFYDRFNGAGITEAELIEDLAIKREEVEFYNDTNNTYGVQSCYGFVQSWWTEGSVENGK